ncbi:unnamed protein product, partial [Staurois parvus]
MCLNAANRIYKCLRLEAFSNCSMSRCCPEPFFIIRNACKAFSMYSNGPSTPAQSVPVSLSHYIMHHTLQKQDKTTNFSNRNLSE